MELRDSTIPAVTLVAEEDLESLAAEWSALLADSGLPWPFLQPAWLQVWLNERAPEAQFHLLTARDGTRLVGIMPILQQGMDLSLAGDSEICDYTDVISLPIERERVLAAFLEQLIRSPWQRLTLWGIRADSSTLAALPELAARFGMTLEIEREAVCPRVSLPATWDAYLLGLSKKDRHELRRKIRRLTEAGGTVREYALSDAGAIAEALADFFHLHTVSRQDKAEFMTPEMERFFRRMTAALAEQDMIRLYFLELDGQRVASVLAFNSGDELWLYNSGFDPAFASVSVGLVSKALALRQAIADGKRCYDFLRGAEPYKYDLGASDLDVFRCRLVRAAQDVNSPESAHASYDTRG